jgi:hypothetical protein
MLETYFLLHNIYGNRRLAFFENRKTQFTCCIFLRAVICRCCFSFRDLVFIRLAVNCEIAFYIHGRHLRRPFQFVIYCHLTLCNNRWTYLRSTSLPVHFSILSLLKKYYVYEITLWSVCLSPISLLGNGSVNTFLQHRVHTKNCWRRHFLCGPCRKKGK